MLTDPPQFCPGGEACPKCGTNRCACPSSPPPSNTSNGEEFCDPTLTDPPQFCPGGEACPKCGTKRCACPSSPPSNGDVFCDPMLTNPPQFCPGGEACPKCGTNKCKCGENPSPDPDSNGGKCEIATETDCGFEGIDEPECQAKGCCWKPDVPKGTPWCVQPGSPDPVPNPDGGKCEMTTETDCGFEGIDEPECQAKGCCWKPDVPQGTPWCVQPGSPSPNGGDGDRFCDPMLTNPPQLCPGDEPCPKCGTNKCKCGDNDGPSPDNLDKEFCDPMLTNPAQLCPGGVPCPKCGTNRCQCPSKRSNVTSVMV
jgi:hypothetical protein